MLLMSRKVSRYEQIQSSLVSLTYATRAQLQAVNDLGGERNARRILLDMERMGYIKSVRLDKKIYYVDTRLKRNEIQHTLMRNDLYIKMGMPKDWAKEKPIRSNGEILLIPDAMFTKRNEYHFVEIDNMQAMRINYDKIKKYKELSKMMFRQYKHHPTLIFYTLSDSRKNKIKSCCNKNGVKVVIL